MWSFAYGKLRWMGDGISRFDVNLAIGGEPPPATRRRSASPASARPRARSFYFGRWFAVRFDARDHVLKEVLVGDEHLVNDFLVTLGFSVFVPFGG